MVANLASAPNNSKLEIVTNSQTKLQSFYRSKLFNAAISVNPFIAAASPILSLLERICVSPTLPCFEELRENIEHELKAFQSKIQEKITLVELERVSYYIMCVVIDELAAKNYIRVNGSNVNFISFTPNSFDEIGPEQRFFELLSLFQQDPNKYLDLLELFYYCLILGFEGKYHGKPDGRQSLDNLIEELYSVITNYRVNQSYQLFYNKHPQNIKKSKKIYMYMFGVTVMIFIILVYSLSYNFLQNRAREMLNHQDIVAYG